MLSESEILYLKTILKTDTVRWENKSILVDLFRHSKFTIRQLIRKMACIDLSSIFRKYEKINKEGTLLMVYKAERLYQALGDANKIFELIAKFLYDGSKLEAIQRQMHMQTLTLDKEA